MVVPRNATRLGVEFVALCQRRERLRGKNEKEKERGGMG
jgi:hypothetical protein